MRRSRRALSVSFLIVTAPLVACGWGSGSDWVKEPLSTDDGRPASGPAGSPRGSRPPPQLRASRTLGAGDTHGDQSRDRSGGGGRVLGTFRNTYYDFPRESEHTGAPVSLKSGSCATIADVPRGFFEAVCVQGSGTLKAGTTVSFAKRDCACAEVCPRTGQRICFDALDAKSFPWGRGATGRPITPLKTVAADTSVLPMGTVIYIPELDGVARENGEGPIDGCFVVEDRGLRVAGEHVDIFVGHRAQRTALEAEVPSNQGVTIVVDAPKCTKRP